MFWSELDSVDGEKLVEAAGDGDGADCAPANEAARSAAVERKLTRRSGDFQQGIDMSEPQESG